MTKCTLRFVQSRTPNRYFPCPNAKVPHSAGCLGSPFPAISLQNPPGDRAAFSASLKNKIRPFLYLFLLLSGCLPEVTLAQENNPSAQIPTELQKIKEAYDNYELETAISIGEAVLSTYASRGWAPDSLLGQTYHLLGSTYYDLGKSELSVENHLKALEIRKDVYGEEHPLVANTYINLCSTCNRWKRLSRARNYCRSALGIFERLQLKTDLDYAYTFLEMGTTALLEGDFEASILLFQKSLDLYLQKYEPDSPELSNHYYSLSNAYLEQGAPKQALFYLQKTYRIDSLSGQTLYMADDLDNIAAAYQLQGAYDQAIFYFNRAIGEFQKLGTQFHFYLAHAHLLKGLCLQEMNRPVEAIAQFKQVLRLLQDSAADRPVDFARANRSMAECYTTQSKFDLAEIHLQRAREAITYDAGAELIFDRSFSLSELQQITAAKAELVFRKYLRTNNETYLREATSQYQSTVRLINAIRSGYRGKESKSKILAVNRQLFERAIETNYYLHQVNPAPRNVEEILQLAEQNKSLLLLESVRANRAKKFADIPDRLLRRENILEADLVSCENRIADLRQSLARNSSAELEKELAARTTELLGFRDQYADLTKTFARDYPRYYQANFDTTGIRIAEIQQQLLPDNSAMIEYFLGPQHLFAIVIRKEESRVYLLETPVSEIKYQVKALRNSIFGNELQNGGTVPSNDPYIGPATRFREAAYALFQQLIQPLNDHPLPEKLIIIPDGILGYIPFEALLTAPPKPNQKLRLAPFMIRQHQISYNYSAALWREMQTQTHQRTRGNLLAVAPIFHTSRTSSVAGASRTPLGPLLHNVPEVEAISQIVGGTELLGEEATKARFLELAPRYRILHLSTHGKANDTRGEASFLAFSATPEGDSTGNRLSVNELYNTELNAEMVVLSACETGIGQVHEGEGIISLARGFSYGGAKSILMTLWQVDDAQTKNIMVSYYRNLKKGLPKDEALRNAKLLVLKEGPEAFTHPFFWSGYVQIGDQAPIRLRSGRWTWWLAGIIGIFLIIYFTLKTRYLPQSKAS